MDEQVAMVASEKCPTYAGLPWGIAYSYQRVIDIAAGTLPIAWLSLNRPGPKKGADHVFY